MRSTNSTENPKIILDTYDLSTDDGRLIFAGIGARTWMRAHGNVSRGPEHAVQDLLGKIARRPRFAPAIGVLAFHHLQYEGETGACCGLLALRQTRRGKVDITAFATSQAMPNEYVGPHLLERGFEQFVEAGAATKRSRLIGAQDPFELLAQDPMSLTTVPYDADTSKLKPPITVGDALLFVDSRFPRRSVDVSVEMRGECPTPPHA